MATPTPAELAARLDRLPMTRHIWVLVTLISLGGCFELYDLFLTAYTAPGLLKAGYFTPESLGPFSVLTPYGIAGIGTFVRAVRRIVCRRHLSRPFRRSLWTTLGLHLLADLVFGHDRNHGVSDLGLRCQSLAFYRGNRHRDRAGDDRHLCLRARAVHPSRPRLCLQPVFPVPGGAIGRLSRLAVRAPCPLGF